MHPQEVPESEMQERFVEAITYQSLNSREIAQLLGISEAAVSRYKGDFRFIFQKKEKIREIATIYIAVIASIKKIYSKERVGKLWFFTYSHKLGDIPIECLSSIEKLLALHHYLLEKVAERNLSKYETFNYS